MADRHKTPPSTYRFTPEEQATMDRLGQALAPRGLPPLRRVEVLRVALARLAEEWAPFLAGGEKKKNS